MSWLVQPIEAIYVHVASLFLKIYLNKEFCMRCRMLYTGTGQNLNDEMTSNFAVFLGQLLLFSQVNHECKFGGNSCWYSATWSSAFGGENSIVKCGGNIEGWM
jgi:hypothetical protein